MHPPARDCSAAEPEGLRDVMGEADTCPVCCGRLAAESAEYESSHVLSLWERKGRRFPQQVLDAFAAYEPTVLFRCRRCGAGFYRPAWSAPAAFYDVLQADSDTYYLQEKWEYGWALSEVRPGDRVLDVGCGAGCFLELARTRGAAAVGIETAPSARAQAISRGFPVYDLEVEDASRIVGREFDVVCAFQVLEHVSEPVAFAKALASCLRQGGKLILAVPNAEGSMRWLKDQSSELPPHHLSEWTATAIEALAERLGLEVLDMAYEPLDVVHHWDHLLGWWRNTVLRGRGADDPYYAPQGFLYRAGSRGLFLLQKVAIRVGLHTLRLVRGHTVAAVLKKTR